MDSETMKNTILSLICFQLIVTASVHADSLPRSYTFNRVIDLTQPLYEGMAYWPGGVPFHMQRLVDYDQGYRLHSFSMGENTGTLCQPRRRAGHALPRVFKGSRGITGAPGRGGDRDRHPEH
jgi:hypothetical protein